MLLQDHLLAEKAFQAATGSWDLACFTYYIFTPAVNGCILPMYLVERESIEYLQKENMFLSYF